MRKWEGNKWKMRYKTCISISPYKDKICQVYQNKNTWSPWSSLGQLLCCKVEHYHASVWTEDQQIEQMSRVPCECHNLEHDRAPLKGHSRALGEKQAWANLSPCVLQVLSEYRIFFQSFRCYITWSKAAAQLCGKEEDLRQSCFSNQLLWNWFMTGYMHITYLPDQALQLSTVVVLRCSCRVRNRSVLSVDLGLPWTCLLLSQPVSRNRLIALLTIGWVLKKFFPLLFLNSSVEPKFWLHGTQQ